MISRIAPVEEDVQPSVKRLALFVVLFLLVTSGGAAFELAALGLSLTAEWMGAWIFTAWVSILVFLVVREVIALRQQR